MRTLLGATLLLAALPASAFGRTITNAELNFTLVVPDRLKPIASPGGDTVAAFATSDPLQGLPEEAVTITRLRGTIGREHLDPSKARTPGVTSVRVRQQKWKSFDIDVIESDVAQGDVRMAVRGAQIPLKNEAIQLNVGVPAGKEAEADALLSELLAGLDGPSNWLTADERGAKLAEGLGKMTVWIAVLAAGLVVGYRAFRKRSA